MLEKLNLDRIYHLLTQKLLAWFETVVKLLPNLFVAVVIVVLFVLLGKLVRKVLWRILEKFSRNKTINRLVQSIVYVGVITAGIFIALEILHLDKTVTSLLAGAGIIGLALGFAFQDIASNFISGILISFRKPFKTGDLIESSDFFGVVEEINLRTTVLTTLQGLTVLIPNKQIFENPLTNYTRTKDRRVDLDVGVSYGEDLRRVSEVTKGSVKGIVFQSSHRDVEVLFHEFGDSSINFLVRFWITRSDQKTFLKAQSEAVIRIKEAFDGEGIVIPFPIRTLDFGIKGGQKLNEVLKNAG